MTAAARWFGSRPAGRYREAEKGDGKWWEADPDGGDELRDPADGFLRPPSSGLRRFAMPDSLAARACEE